MEFERENLLNVLESLRPGLSSKDIIEQMTHFIFTADEVLTYNDLVCVRQPLEAGFEASVSADDLLKLLRKTRAKNVTLEKKGEVIRIEADRMVAELAIMLESELAEQLEVIESEIYSEKAKWYKLPVDFKQAIKLCQYAASLDDSLPILTNIWINENKAVGFDNTRLSIYEMEGVLPEFLLKASMVNDLLNYDISEMQLSNSWIHFATDTDIVFSVRRMMGEYSDKVIEYADNFEGELFNLPVKEFRQAVDVVSTIVEKDELRNRWVEVAVSKSEVTCKAEKDSRGWVQETFTHDSKLTKTFSFEVNPIFLLDILDEKMAVYIGTKAIKMTSPNFKHLLGVK